MRLFVSILLLIMLGAARPQAAPAPSETRLIMLGTGGGPVIRRNRSQPAAALVVRGRVYLVDAGDDVARQLALAGFRPSSPDVVFLTHLHLDHTAGLASLIAFAWTELRASPIDIYGPPGATALATADLRAFAISEDLFRQELVIGRPMASIVRAHDIDVTAPRLIYRDDLVKVWAVENSHYATLEPRQRGYGPARSYAYRFETPGRVVVFTGDTGPSPAVERLAVGADVLVSEVIDLDKTLALVRERWRAPEAELKPVIDHMAKEHLRPEDVGRLAARAGVKMVVLTHFAPGADEETDPSPYVDGVRREYSGPVVAARDLDEF
ncbi:MAG: MBL fold metallo-hydrolase [Caulobacteraceae bacterium]|nr:MBL fold metallo-hydrolase [Caulobacteraceae bacterium]